MASDQYKLHHPSYAGRNQWSHHANNSAENHLNRPPTNDYQIYNYTLPASTSMDMPDHMVRPLHAPQHWQFLPIQSIDPPIWPSMLIDTTSQPSTNYQTPVLPAVPVQTSIEAAPKRPFRQKLTDDYRRQICIEATTHPDMKQNQIALKFGVERSTVSKTLRQKDKYMNSTPVTGSSESKSDSRDFSELTIVGSSTALCADGHLDQSSASSTSGLVSPAISLGEDGLQRKVNGNDDSFGARDRYVDHLLSLGEVVSPHLESGSVVLSPSVSPQDLYVNPREMMKRSESVPNIRDASAIYESQMRPPPLPKSRHNSRVSPGSPTPEEALRALRTLQSFFQAQPPEMSLDIDDWTSIGNMRRKLRLPRSANEDVPGGRVPLEILNDPRPIKKRAIFGIST